MEHEELLSVIEAILFAAGDPVPASRIALVTGEETQTIVSAARELAAAYEENRCGMRLVQMNDLLQLCSAPEYAEYIRRALEQRKPPKLSQPALEVLAIVAYFQPVTRAYIDQVRGVDSAYTVTTLLERGLIEASASSTRPAARRCTARARCFCAPWVCSRSMSCLCCRICRPTRARKSSNRPSRNCAAAASRWS